MDALVLSFFPFLLGLVYVASTLNIPDSQYDWADHMLGKREHYAP